MNFTPAQLAAIVADRNVLVVAGAGTGKTRTLIQRCLRLILEGESLDRLLLVTFTEAAAAEMKARLRAGLDDQMARHPAQPHLQEQLALLDNAQICTLHSFCLQLIREHFHELALDPQIVVLDEAQLQPLVEESMQAALEVFLTEGRELGRANHTLLAQLAGDGATGLRRLIWRLHRHAQTLPHPNRWLSEQRALFAQPEPTQWRDGVREEFCQWYPDWKSRLESDRAQPNLGRCAEVLASLGEHPDPGSIAGALEAIRVADEDTPWPRGTKTKSRKPFERFFEEATFFRSMLVATGAGEDALHIDWDLVRGEMLRLLEMVEKFERSFHRAKRELGGVDFSDIEQLSLRLLWSEGDVPTSVAQDCRERFAHVFVDEVQDINAAQDAILRGVSREGAAGNRFLVGDIKQSIYRFRLANPAIFRGYFEAWRGPSADHQVIALSDNFRSREGILKYVNLLFDHVMASGLGGVVYDPASHLGFGNPVERVRLRHSAGECRVQLRILTNDSPVEGEPGEGEGEEGEELLSSEEEARWLAAHLSALRRSGHLVWDDSLKEFRAVRWSDIVILLRSPGAKVESFAKEFHRAAIPFSAPRGGFFESQEILDLLSLLRLLDNPLQDIPLLAVLRSPLGGFTPADLVNIRLVEKRVPFWTALVRAADPSLSAGCETLPPATRDRARIFVDNYTRWRRSIRLGVLSNCLETILADTHYEALLEAEERSQSRLMNIRRLLDLTRQYDPYQRQGLFRFLRFVEAQQEAELDLESASAVVPEAVRLMSIHKSKGLEFPVVVVADLNKPFNLADLTQDVLLDERLGLCPRVVLPDSGLRYPSAAHWLARRRGRQELLGEELRLLYVALTRAKDLLILVGHGKTDEWTRQTDAEPCAAGPVKPWEVAQARSFLNWIQLSFRRHTAPGCWADEWSGQTDLLGWHIGPLIPSTAPLNPEVEIHSPVTGPSPTEDLMANLESRLTWTYPHPLAVSEPAKTAVSTLRHRQQDLNGEPMGYLPALVRSTAERAVRSESGISATERGTLHHLFLQWMDLARADSVLDLRNEGERLRRASVLSEEELRNIDFAALAAFWQSEVGIRIRQRRDQVQRELPFTTRLSAPDLRWLGVLPPEAALDDEEFVVVQGQVDLAVVLEKEIWLLDFKTDRISAEQTVQRAETYRTQIQIYALALERIFGRPVTARWLHFLAAGMTVDAG